MNTKNKIFIFINNLYKINARTNIFYELPKNDDFPLGNYVAKYIIFHEKELNNYLNYIDSVEINDFAKKVAGYSTERTIKTVIKLNQYVEVDAILANKLYDLYEDFMVKVIEKLYLNGSINFAWINRIVMEHQLKLRSILGTIDELRIFSNTKKFVEPIPCSEYSVALQLRILDINIERIKEPILDFGCGSKATLVHYLTKLGLEAYGVDRITNNKLYTIQTDWLNYELKPNYWGTIISHLSFSNHFKRTHFKMNGNYIEYARKYMELLNSLKPGGEFYYTPNLPFIEQFLSPKSYKINKNFLNYDIQENREPLDIMSVRIEKLIKATIENEQQIQALSIY
ncbi:hypothetical protein [Desulfosporosinus nitroreducens]|uniref:hypothetical protein n=1 Tax=Desulfosporosinus nitroreducens TaxID=2018668 RepID=UPI00207D65BA|nr:hypothetical protein [Desulfosporosinus nitroreducens]MCO1604493.1 hypothetical protein [Desulfosporosinus nitroreducens]